ncbi:hypothetical protein JCM10296v2_004132 [Rhodotorula toruloides]
MAQQHTNNLNCFSYKEDYRRIPVLHNIVSTLAPLSPGLARAPRLSVRDATTCARDQKRVSVDDEEGEGTLCAQERWKDLRRSSNAAGAQASNQAATPASGGADGSAVAAWAQEWNSLAEDEQSVALERFLLLGDVRVAKSVQQHLDIPPVITVFLLYHGAQAILKDLVTQASTAVFVARKARVGRFVNDLVSSILLGGVNGTPNLDIDIDKATAASLLSPNEATSNIVLPSIELRDKLSTFAQSLSPDLEQRLASTLSLPSIDDHASVLVLCTQVASRLIVEAADATACAQYDGDDAVRPKNLAPQLLSLVDIDHTTLSPHAPTVAHAPTAAQDRTLISIAAQIEKTWSGAVIKSGSKPILKPAPRQLLQLASGDLLEAFRIVFPSFNLPHLPRGSITLSHNCLHVHIIHVDTPPPYLLKSLYGSAAVIPPKLTVGCFLRDAYKSAKSAKYFTVLALPPAKLVEHQLVKYVWTEGPRKGRQFYRILYCADCSRTINRDEVGSQNILTNVLSAVQFGFGAFTTKFAARMGLKWKGVGDAAQMGDKGLGEGEGAGEEKGSEDGKAEVDDTTSAQENPASTSAGTADIPLADHSLPANIRRDLDELDDDLYLNPEEYVVGRRAILSCVCQTGK